MGSGSLGHTSRRPFPSWKRPRPTRSLEPQSRKPPATRSPRTSSACSNARAISSASECTSRLSPPPCLHCHPTKPPRRPHLLSSPAIRLTAAPPAEPLPRLELSSLGSKTHRHQHLPRPETPAHRQPPYTSPDGTIHSGLLLCLPGTPSPLPPQGRGTHSPSTRQLRLWLLACLWPLHHSVSL